MLGKPANPINHVSLPSISALAHSECKFMCRAAGERAVRNPSPSIGLDCAQKNTFSRLSIHASGCRTTAGHFRKEDYLPSVVQHSCMFLWSLLYLLRLACVGALDTLYFLTTKAGSVKVIEEVEDHTPGLTGVYAKKVGSLRNISKGGPLLHVGRHSRRYNRMRF